jgi:peptidoglycan/xylan/chitin deacetylase (PgdA/CDA1 family)
MEGSVKLKMKRTAVLFDELVFPNGKAKAFTLSYDDGTIHDRRMLDIVNKYGVRGTFNLNSGFLGVEDIQEGPLGTFDQSKISAEEITSLYEGHEVAGHGLYHASPTDVGTSAFMYETIEDKAALEKIIGKLVRGYAYPFGNFNDNAKVEIMLGGDSELDAIIESLRWAADRLEYIKNHR